MSDGDRTSRVVAVYGSPRVDGMYLYVDAGDTALAAVPEALLARFGVPRHVMSVELWPQRRLARVDAAAVLAALDGAGYFLQLPPPRSRG